MIRHAALLTAGLVFVLPLSAAERVALLVGCANYRSDPAALSLDTPLNDINDLAATLESPALGFQVIKVADATRESFDAGLAKFKAAASEAQVAMVYFSGHGIEHENENYLITVNATLESEFQLSSQTMPLENVMKVLGGTSAAVKVAVLDCCRNTPFKTKSWVKTKDFVSDQVLRELGEAEIPKATLVCFATGAGRKAAATLTAGCVRSPFTDELIKEIVIPGIPLRTVFENVHDRLVEATQGRQVPAVKTDNALSAVFRKTVLVKGTPPPAAGGLAVMPQPPAPATPPPPLKSGTASVRAGAPASPVVSGPDEGAVGSLFQVKLPGDVAMSFCYCPPGSFVMGSPKNEKERHEDEAQVPVKISKGFWLGQMELTQGQWSAVMEATLADQQKGASYGYVRAEGPEQPMYFVSWNDAQIFLTTLNQAVKLPGGWKFTLPTEAQWEYACRAGTESVFHSGDTLSSKQANFDGQFPYGFAVKGPYLEKTSPVGSYAANAWGLHDMPGNVWEWCTDWYGDKLAGGTDPVGPDEASSLFVVCRGGSWFERGRECRSASRSRASKENREGFVGFRVAVVPR